MVMKDEALYWKPLLDFHYKHCFGIPILCNILGEEKLSSALKVSSAWCRNKIDMRQINRRKKPQKFNSACMEAQ